MAESTMVPAILPEFVEPPIDRPTTAINVIAKVQPAQEATQPGAITSPDTPNQIPSIVITTPLSPSDSHTVTWTPNLETEPFRKNYWAGRARSEEIDRESLRPTTKAATDIKPRTNKFIKFCRKHKAQDDAQRARKKEDYNRKKSERAAAVAKISEINYHRMHEAKGGVVDLVRKLKRQWRERKQHIDRLKRKCRRVQLCGGESVTEGDDTERILAPVTVPVSQ
ncbi:MAG: hypothetical protein Q9169_005641 [Polycauliona sp. 2 TL-2023]